jgi:hypothetical protein
MKKLILLLALVAISHSIVFSQGCLPEGINFEWQEQIDNFQNNYPGCTEIEGNVTIGILEVGSDINNLDGLNGLISIGGDLVILWNYQLENLIGLDNIISIGGNLIITENYVLNSLTGLENVSSVGGDIEIINNEYLGGVAGLTNLTTISGGLHIYGNSLQSLWGFHNLISIGEDLHIWYTSSLNNLNGLENITSLNGSLSLSLNTSLNDLSALGNITSVGGDLSIGSCDGLDHLTGLENITNVGGLQISNNNYLTDLSGLNNLTSVGGDLWIAYNDELHSLIELQNLASIGGGIWIGENYVLSNLFGLENIDPNSVSNLTIYENPNLSDCDVQSVCEYLVSPNGTVDIHDNAPDCNSVAEVEAACLTSIEDNIAKEEIALFPNPATSFITIHIKEGIPIEETIIYNHLGQKALVVVPVNNAVDVSTLKPGIYFIELATKDWKGRTKLVKQ